jgi:hypothetical protein
MMFRKCLIMVINDKFGLDKHADVTEKLTPSVFDKETNLLNADGILTL